MKTSSELSTLYKSIDQSKISDKAKETLTKIRLANKNWKRKDEDAQQVFIDFFNKLKETKPTAVKTTQEYKDALKQMRIETGKRVGSARKKSSEPKGGGNEVDANRPAKPYGWRMRGKHNYRKPTRADIEKGRAYYEGRVNRADVKRKKYPMLKRGGMAEGGEVYYVNDFYPNYDEDKIAQVLKDNGFKKVRKGKKYGWSNQPDVVIFQGDENKAKEILEKEFDNYISINEKDWGRKYEDGGYMAEGGEVGEINTELINVKNNIMGTTTLEMKIKGMRKPQNFIVYPISADQSKKPIMIQSDTRFGFLDLSTGEGLMSQSHANGAYSYHFQTDKKVHFKLSQNDIERIKNDLSKKAGSKVGNSVVFSDNSGANMMAKGGEIKAHNGEKYKEEFSGSNRWLQVDDKYKMTSEEHENEASKYNLSGNYELRDMHRKIAKSLSQEPIMLKDGGYMAKGGLLTNGKNKYEKGDEGMYEGKEVRVVKLNLGRNFYDYDVLDENGNVKTHGVAPIGKFENQFRYFPKMAKGGMINHGFRSGDKIIEIYKGYGIIETSNGAISVINPSNGSRFVVEDESDAKNYIDNSTPIELIERVEVGSGRNGSMDSNGVEYGNGGVFYTEKHKND